MEYMVGGPEDLMGTPPSARGFTLKAYERGTGNYANVFRATEENGYGFRFLGAVLLLLFLLPRLPLLRLLSTLGSLGWLLLRRRFS
jgi:hypothetical protein